jgi:hypothetical protein
LAVLSRRSLLLLLKDDPDMLVDRPSFSIQAKGRKHLSCECRRRARSRRFTGMQKKERTANRKAEGRKSKKATPVPPVKKDVGHGDEVAPAKEQRDEHNSPKKTSA